MMPFLKRSIARRAFQIYIYISGITIIISCAQLLPPGTLISRAKGNIEIKTIIALSLGLPSGDF